MEIIHQKPMVKIETKINVYAITALMLPVCLSTSGQQDQPSFILIVADDLGYGDLGCYGHPTIMTPNLDRMADEGMRFTQFYVGAAVCSPSRAALLTGRYGFRTGVYGTDDPLGNTGVVFLQNSAGGLPPSEITMAEVLKEKGYATGIIGKWHLGHMPEYLPFNQGFDYWFGIDHHQNGPEKLPSVDTVSPAQGTGTTTQTSKPWCSLYRNDTVIEEYPDMRFFTQRFTAEALTFVEKNRNRPFFLYFASNNPHVPLYASHDFEGKSKRGTYGDVVEEIDWSVGKILSKLRELRLEHKTMVVFMSDNGPWLTRLQNGGSAGLLRDGKNSAWEGGMRVPFIAWWPGTIPENTVSASLATAMDLLPTFCRLAGADIPDGRMLDGTDISPLLFNTCEMVRDKVFYYINDKLYAIRKGPWKAHFITHPSYSDELPVMHDPPLLYQLEIDPSEKYDVSVRHPAVVEEFKRLFETQIIQPEAPSEIDRILKK